MLRLDNPIDRKRPTRLHLTILAMTGMDEHGLGGEFVLHGAAEAEGEEESHRKLFTLILLSPILEISVRMLRLKTYRACQLI